MSTYTILLARPDYIATSSLDTYLAEVTAESRVEALVKAQHEAWLADGGMEYPDEPFGDSEDYAMLALMEGSVEVFRGEV